MEGNEKRIVVNEDDSLILEIYDKKGNKTGECLQFDLGDIDLPLRYQELIEKDKKNRETLRNAILVIEKRQDVPGKNYLSKNQEDSVRAVVDFFKKEVEIYNMFLGENGVQKLLNGRKLKWDTLDEIDHIINDQIRPYIEEDIKKVKEKVINVYGKYQNKGDEIEVLE
jgi:hypothetical protein